MNNAIVIGQKTDGSEAWRVDVKPGVRVRTSEDMGACGQTGDVVRVYKNKVSVRFMVRGTAFDGETRTYTVALNSIRPVAEVAHDRVVVSA